MYALNLASATNLFTNIWKQNAPPKIKHFWWRAVHNALPTADNLKKRKVTIDDTCQSCGEAPEDVNHLLFQCRVSREVWQHTPLQSPSGNILMLNSLIQNVELLRNLNHDPRKDASLFPFIGWRIWKMRNDIIFNNK
ncbi:putative reverse transcriptase zinc-binding domain-containing protein [Arabidopsis thaliana]